MKRLGLIKREIAGDLQGIQVEGEDEEDDFKPIFNLWGLHGFQARHARTLFFFFFFSFFRN